MALYNNPYGSGFNNYGTQPNNYGALNSNNVNQNFGNGTYITVMVKGEDGARNYPVAAGNTVLLMDFDSNQFWLKSTAPNGVLQPLRNFSFIENTPKVEANQDTSSFVTKKELDDLRVYLDGQFQGIRTQMFKMKKPKEEK